MDEAETESGAATGGVRLLLRLEGLALFAAMVVLYALRDDSWGFFALLFLAPDLSFIAYLASGKTGAIAYNAAHSSVAPAALLALGFALGSSPMLSLGLIWLAHIGFDRALGYGLKYSAGFSFTHLGRIGRASKPLGKA